MHRTTFQLNLDPFILAVAVIAGAAALLLGAGGWAVVVAGVALVAGVGVGQAWRALASLATLRYLDAQDVEVLRRARSAVRTARRLNRAAPEGPIAERFRIAEMQLEASAAGADRLIRRAIAVRKLRNGLDPGAVGRVNAVILKLTARALSLVESLESVVARQIEVLALADTDPSGTALAALERLGVEVDALCAGLEEAQRLGGDTPLKELSEETR